MVGSSPGRPRWLTLRNAAVVLAELAVAVGVFVGALGVMGIEHPATSAPSWVGGFIVWPLFATVFGVCAVLPQAYLAAYDPVGPPWVWILGVLANVLYVFGLVRAVVWLGGRARAKVRGGSAMATFRE